MDNLNDLWKVPISELSLVLLNNEGVNKNLVYKELKRRTSGLDERILSHDEWVVERRGLNRDNYLIGKKPSLQLLFETYINYVSDSTPYHCNFSQILFSEMPLCNQMFFKNNFFYTIYNN